MPPERISAMFETVLIVPERKEASARSVEPSVLHQPGRELAPGVGVTEVEGHLGFVRDHVDEQPNAWLTAAAAVVLDLVEHALPKELLQTATPVCVQLLKRVGQPLT